jgi:hypothetical protein
MDVDLMMGTGLATTQPIVAIQMIQILLMLVMPTIPAGRPVGCPEIPVTLTLVMICMLSAWVTALCAILTVRHKE